MGTPSLFPFSTGVAIDNNVIPTPGASIKESSGLLGRCIGAAAAGSIANAVVLRCVTLADVEVGLDGTRHGRTLAELFSSVLQMEKKQEGVTTLMIAVQCDGDGDASLDSDEIEEVVKEIFDSVAAAIGTDGELSNYLAVQSTLVNQWKILPR